MKIAVIGAGISGVSASRLLVERGFSVEVFEKNERPGGLIQCERVDGNLFHKIGGHVFNSKNPQVLQWFWKNFDRENEFIQATRHARIFLNGEYVGYPLENFIYQLPKTLVKEITKDLMALHRLGVRAPFSYPNFEEFLLGNFGKTLYELYFKPYNTKIWNTKLSDVSMEWLEGKLPMPNYEATILSNILRQEETQMVHSTFYYPKNGGSQFIIDRLADSLVIHAGIGVTGLKATANQWFVNDKGPFDAVIYTGDVRELVSLCSGVETMPSDVVKSVRSLRSNGTSNYLCYCDDTDLSWLYLPEPSTLAHRIIYTGNFSPSNNRTGARRTCVVEFSGLVSEDVMRTEISKLPGNLVPIQSSYEPNSYVIQDANTRATIKKVKSEFGPKKLFLCGRFAEWEYYNMDKAIESAMLLVDEEFNFSA